MTPIGVANFFTPLIRSKKWLHGPEALRQIFLKLAVYSSPGSTGIRALVAKMHESSHPVRGREIIVVQQCHQVPRASSTAVCNA